MSNPFGDEAADPSANPFGDQAAPATKITDPNVAQFLTNQFYRAAADGPAGEQAKQSIFKLMQAHGVNIGAPTLGTASMNGVADGSGSTAENMAAGSGSAMQSIPRNALESVLRGGPMGMAAGFVQKKLGLPTAYDAPLIGPALTSLRNARQAQDAQDAPLLATKAGLAGDIGTHVLPFVAGGAIGAASDAPALSTILNPSTLGAATVQGAMLGAATPTDSLGQQAHNTAFGGLGGLGGAALGKALGAAARAPSSMYQFLSQRLTDKGAAQRVAQDLIEKGVSRTPTIARAPLPGINLNSAQATADPTLAILTRARNAGDINFARANSDQFGQNRNVVNTAVQNLAGTPQQLADAIKARSDAVSPLYHIARNATGLDMSGPLSAARRGVTRLEGNPAAQTNMQDIVDLLTKNIPESDRLKGARNAINATLSAGRRSSGDHEALTEAARITNMRGQTVDDAIAAIRQLRPSSQSAQDTISAALKTLKTASIPQDRGLVLDNIRTTLGDMISGKGVTQSGKQRLSDINVIPLKTRLQAAFAKQVPEFGQAQQQFQAMSGDVNQRQILQAIGGENGSAFDMRGNVTLGKLNSALTSGKSLVKSATGMKNRNLADMLSPDQMNTLGGARDYLQMADHAQNLASGGNSHTSQNTLTNAAMKTVASHIPGVKYLVAAGKMLDQAGQSRYTSALNAALLDPSKLQEALDLLPSQQRLVAMQMFRSIMPSGGLVGSQSAIARGQ